MAPAGTEQDAGEARADLVIRREYLLKRVASPEFGVADMPWVVASPYREELAIATLSMTTVAQEQPDAEQKSQRGSHDRKVIMMKKLKHEGELFKAGLLAAMKYAQERGAVVFEPTDSASQKLLYVYRLLVHDKMIQPLPEDQVAEDTMRHKLAIWYSKQLPEDHPLLK